MYESLILRYSGSNTIQDHSDLITEFHSTWWGWWAKDDQEAFPLSFLEWARQAASKNPIRIGLVDRKDNRFASAVCEEVVFGQGGERLAAPDDGQRTPEYYRSLKCRAWFRITRIDAVKLVDFKREFVDIPVGDTTLYVVSDSAGHGREILPKPNWSFAVVNAPGTDVLHISDLHFGSFHGYSAAATPPGTGTSATLLSDRLLQLIEKGDHSVGAVLVTGDLVSKGTDISSTLEIFDSLAKSLMDRLGLLPEHFVIIPGNHDFLTVTDFVEMKIDYKHEREFKSYIRSFYGRSVATDLEQPFRLNLSDTVELAGVALNSARLRDENSRDYGYVSAHRYDVLLRLLCEAIDPAGVGPNHPTILSALLHHHLIPVNAVDEPMEGRHVSVTVDAGQILSDFSVGGVQIAFHGHQHLPFLGAVQSSRPSATSWTPLDFDHRTLILGAGSAGVSRASLPDAFPYNSAWVYRFPEADRVLEYSLWRYLPGVEPARATTGRLDLAPWRSRAA